MKSIKERQLEFKDRTFWFLEIETQLSVKALQMIAWRAYRARIIDHKVINMLYKVTQEEDRLIANHILFEKIKLFYNPDKTII